MVTDLEGERPSFFPLDRLKSVSGLEIHCPGFQGVNRYFGWRAMKNRLCLMLSSLPEGLMVENQEKTVFPAEGLYNNIGEQNSGNRT
ncbi:MAG: hypothetical protein BRC30_04050 [Nanohaloarchaea archaeon SW_7_46_7]|nr:MAG: hypothetical protein BRC30_04050 [Nanohaloarchaea archaeon SW_7_46_7]